MHALPLTSQPTPLPQRVLLVENSRAYVQAVAQAIEHQLELPVTAASTLAEARQALEEHDDWFMVLTGLVLADGDRDMVVDCFLDRGLPTVVVSGVYDEDLRERMLRRQIIDFVVKSTPGNLDYIVWLVQRLERNRRISALVVDDSPSARTHAAALLEMFGYRVVQAADGPEALRALEGDQTIRLAVVDQEMPGMQGIELTRRLRALRTRDRVAVIGVSGRDDPGLVARFLKNGANDFLRKPYTREEFFCRVSQNVDQLELIGSLQDLATRDFLTGLPNRRHFLEQAERMVPRLQDVRAPVAAAMLDIDHFKHINDSWGHDTGDQALRAVAAAVSSHARRQDQVARFGGEEFCLLVPGLEGEELARYFEDLRQRIEDLRVPVRGSELQMTVSIGVRSAEPGDDLHRLLTEADRRLYLAKAAGRNRVIVSD
ncbi:diguanylate cyclase response regulator [Pseudoxanthomonas broegbernensis]|uniref:diguanylate cyclase n=1 Tax=Pseudoxanthomonas broegbernensis TaxID=83619 RepID=A0A7V8GP59_9GAMM|nr:diguanylate cyclase [Pseudoxanthomonas broegbernensis]KAF1687461.1 diguanylate cyclase response regulator [Pseudoxanthomonas broegbernensis]MBB6064460.1 diguanylate cyclase (GGDEF)-like protein [Pseudoxanthomonas broegbernensis]